MNVDEAAWADGLGAETSLRLRTRRLGAYIRTFGRTDSTMSRAAAWLAEGAPDGALVIAAAQTAGRGRMGRTWHDRPGASLLCSVVLRTEAPPGLLGLVPLAAGVAAAAAVDEASGVKSELKWPNDVLVAGRKVAGVLVEGRAGALIVGLGVNVAAGSAPDDTGVKATSLEEEAGRPLAAADVLAPFLDRLEELVDGLQADAGAAIRAQWESRMHRRGEAVAARAGSGEPVEGVALGLAPDGALRLETPAGEVRVYAGDVGSVVSG